MQSLIPCVSSLIVEDLGKYSLAPMEGIAGMLKMKLLNVLVKNRPRRWKFFTSNQYLAYDIHISDLLSNNSSDELKIIKIESSNIPGYDSERNIGAGITGKASLKIFEALPNLKAGAGVNSYLSVKIISGGLTMKTVDEKALEEAMRRRTVEKDHTFIKAFLNKSRRRLCVIKTVVETSQKTVIEFANTLGGNVNIAAEIGTQGGSVNSDINKSKTGRIILDAGTVLACQWQPLDVDKDTGEISLCYKLHGKEKLEMVRQRAAPADCGSDEELNESVQKENETNANVNETLADLFEAGTKVNEAGVEINEPSEEESESREEGSESSLEGSESNKGITFEDVDDGEETDDDEETDMHRRRITLDESDYKNLYNMFFAREDDIRKLKTAGCAVMKSNNDIVAILDLYDRGKGNDVEVQTFRGYLQTSDAVWSLLELIGYKCENNHINMTWDGPFPSTIESLLQAMLLFEIEDLELIEKCNAYQKKEILRIIVAALKRPDRIPIDPLFKQELQKDPVENIMALLSFDIDFEKGELSQESNKICILEPMMYLLSCL